MEVGNRKEVIAAVSHIIELDSADKKVAAVVGICCIIISTLLIVSDEICAAIRKLNKSTNSN